MDDRRGYIGGDRDCLDAVEHSADRAHVLLQRVEDRQRVLKDIDTLRGESTRSAGTAAEKTKEVPLMRW